MNDETRNIIPDEASQLSVPGTHFDRQSHTHHTVLIIPKKVPGRRIMTAKPVWTPVVYQSAPLSVLYAADACPLPNPPTLQFFVKFRQILSDPLSFTLRDASDNIDPNLAFLCQFRSNIKRPVGEHYSSSCGQERPHKGV